VPVAVVGVIGAIVAWVWHDNDPEFGVRRGPDVVERESVEKIISLAPDPTPEKGRTRARKAQCRPGSPSDLRNPWRCRVEYAAGTRVTYTVDVRRNGRMRGVDRSGTLIVSGCCVDTPRSG
jgi:hypothetical protein